jgi:threonine synthase
VNFYSKYKKVIEPHGAVGWAAVEKFHNENPECENVKTITFETANPSKFPEEIIELIEIVPEIPNSLKAIQDKQEFPNPKEINEYSDFKGFLQRVFKG